MSAYTCAIIMLSDRHFDPTHLRGGWNISAKDKCFANADLVRFVRNRPFVCVEKALDPLGRVDGDGAMPQIPTR